MSDFNIEDYKLQAYLLSCAEEIIDICNRNAPPSTEIKAKFQASGDPLAERFFAGYLQGYEPNPQPVVLKKIVNDAEDDVDAALLSNALTPEDSTKFVTDLPDDIRRSLNPYITVFKTFIPGGEQGGDPQLNRPVDIEIATQKKGKDIKNNPKARQMKFLAGRGAGSQFGVAVRDVEIVRLGGNPAEVDSNIKVRISMYATNMADFFARQKDESQVRYPKENPADPNSRTLNRNDFADQEEILNQIDNGVAWIDLIKIKLEEDDTKHIDNYYEKVATKNNIDTKENVYNSFRDTLSYNEYSQRIKLEVGYSIPSILDNYAPADKELYSKLIAQQKEVYYLSLVSNQINFNEDGTVEISCNYIASCGTGIVDRSTDLLFEPWVYERSLQLHDHKCEINHTMPTEDVNDKLEKLAEIRRDWQINMSAEWYEMEQDFFGDEGAPEDTIIDDFIIDPFNAYMGAPPPSPASSRNLAKTMIPFYGGAQAAKNINANVTYTKAQDEARSGVLEDDEEKREALIKIDTSIKKLRKIQSGLLINGLYGGQLLKRAETPGFNPENDIQYDSLTTIQKKSRVYYHAVRDTDVVDRISSTLSRTSDSAASKPYVANMGDLWFFKDGGQAAPGETHQQVKQKDLERFHDRAASAKDQTQGGGTNIIHGYETDLEFTFLGDIIEVALEVLASNNRCGETGGYGTRRRLNQLPPQLIFAGATVADVEKTAFIRPFYWDLENERKGTYIDYAAVVKERQWSKDLADIVGEVATSYITYNSPSIPAEEIKISLADLPISMLEFKKWFSQNIENRTSLPIKQYLEMLIRWATRLCDKAMTFNKDQTTNVEPPQLLINKYFVNYQDPQFLSDSRILPSAVSLGGATVPNTKDKAYNTRDVERIFQFVKDTQTLDNDSFSIYSSKVLTLLSQESTILTTSPPSGKTRIERDREQNVPHIYFGDSTTGILQNLSFQREDMPGLREARLFEGTNMSGMSMLREKYNAELRLIGTSFFKPGTIFYVDPDPLNLGHSTNDVASPARELGLGGYYFTTRVTHNLDFTSQGNWETRIESKWNSFGDKKDEDSKSSGLRRLEKSLQKSKCSTSFKRRWQNALNTDNAEDQELLRQLIAQQQKP